ncbi:other/BUB protein kinase [Coprinopsis sp. MPI-PUGE-AT-0042]|nr:other/BUB protein kinase [Coprinopsis sp. MPI-PUGE-AT-0042]
MSSRSGTTSTLSDADRERHRQKYRAKLAKALKEDDDPLATYNSFVQWTIKHYGEKDNKSGLFELLKEATNQFKEDPMYKNDLRYLKMWALYARQLHRTDAAKIYAFLVENGIGTAYSALYEDYANLLERDGRRAEAEKVYLLGMEKKVRPLERLKTRYQEFQSRAASGSGQASSNKAAPTASSSSIPPSTSSSATTSSANLVSFNSTAASRYALMLAPTPPGKRPEKLKFNMGLLFTEEGVEYSIQEARARSMGLLGKKWGPPPPSESSSAPVDFNDDGVKSTKSMGLRRRSMLAEPTVTINTKEALADVFGMYNSPERTTKFTPGSQTYSIEEGRASDPNGSSSIGRSPNDNARCPQGMSLVEQVWYTITQDSQFNVFVEDQNKTPFITPRNVFAPKDASTPSMTRPSNENPPRSAFRPVSSLASITEDGAGTGASENKPLFGKVFNPPQSEPVPLAPLRDVFTDDHGKPTPKPKPPTHERAKSHDVGDKSLGPVFTPFVDENSKTPFKVFTHPSENDEGALGRSNPFTPKTPTVFTPFQDSKEPPATFTPFGSTNRAFTPNAPRMTMTDGASYQQEVPLGGRFGQFNVMTPITERTFEYTTMSGRTDATPSGRYGGTMEGEGSPKSKAFVPLLRDQLEEDEDQGMLDHEDQSPALEERTGALSLVDTLTLNTKFRPPNPCNPFDPPILSTLLSRIQTDSHFFDLRDHAAQKLEQLQKHFKKSTGRKNSGSLTDIFSLTLESNRFQLSEKLGEGGFGCVFKAKDLGLRTGDEDEDEDDDFDDLDEDLDEENASMVAIKVVKPRNLWEYHALRRLHSALPINLRRSLVIPHALYAYGDESFLIMDLCTQGMLLDIVNTAVSAGVSQAGACLDELLVFFFTIELLRLVEGMHGAGFIHGDLKIDNCLLRLEDVPGGATAWSALYQPSGEGGWAHKGLKVIDFGRTIDTRLFPADQQYIAEWPTDERDCFEIQQGRPWTYQTDYFGLAGIIYCMLFGKYITSSAIVQVQTENGDTRHKIGTPFKRYWQAEIWTKLFDMLLNPVKTRTDGSLPLTTELAEVRTEMEVWLQANCNRTSNTLKGLLKKVEKSCYTR